MFNPAHPGEVLKEYLDGITVTEAAQKLGMSRVSLSRILNGKTAITAETALRLAKGLKTSANFWLNMQVEYDLWQTQLGNPHVTDNVVALRL